MVPLVIDTDGGVDDALALLLALRAPEVDLRAVTTVAGNTDVAQATRNVRTVCGVAGLPEPLIAMGCDQPILGGRRNVPSIHGADGLGELTQFADGEGSPLYPTPTLDGVEGNGVTVLIEAAREFGEDLTVVSLGPLTNLAVAARLDLAAMSRIGRVVIMGGAFRVPGNISPFAEYNVWSDPEAAHIVLSSLANLEWVGLDVALQVPLSRVDVRHNARTSGSPVAGFVEHCTEFYMDFYRENEGHDGCFLHDPLAVCVAIDPSLVSLEELSVRVELASPTLRGMTAADLRARRGEFGHGTLVATHVDADRVMAERIWPALA